MTARQSQSPALGAQATKQPPRAARPRPITDPNEVPVSRFLLPFVALAGVDLRGKPIAGAQCRFDPDLHTGSDANETPEERAAREDVAREVCASCPLRLECLEFALRTLPEHGIWSGLTAGQIAALAEDLFTGPPLSEVA